MTFALRYALGMRNFWEAPEEREGDCRWENGILAGVSYYAGKQRESSFVRPQRKTHRWSPRCTKLQCTFRLHVCLCVNVCSAPRQRELLCLLVTNMVLQLGLQTQHCRSEGNH